MNDAWATLLAAAVGFFAATLTEPIKAIVSNWNRKSNLRLALYKELIFSSFQLEPAVVLHDAKNMDIYATKLFLKMEAYKQTIQKDAILFYLLDESDEFGLMYGLLARIIDFPDAPKYSVQMKRNFVERVEGLLDAFSSGFTQGMLDKQAARKLMSEGEYKSLLARGEAALEKAGDNMTLREMAYYGGD